MSDHNTIYYLQILWMTATKGSSSVSLPGFFFPCGSAGVWASDWSRAQSGDVEVFLPGQTLLEEGPCCFGDAVSMLGAVLPASASNGENGWRNMV